MEKKLLIISYVYPPDNGIGGRRWSKFAKCLAERGNKVFVITATPDKDNDYSTQVLDGAEVHRVKSPYPRILRFMGKMNLWNKIDYKLSKAYFSFINKGNIYDTSIGWDKNLVPAIISLIKKEGIKNIVVTAPPYRHMYYVSKLKSIYPDINIILDFRDPWTELEALSAMLHTSPKRFTAEKELEKQTLASIDYVVTVSEGRTQLFEKLVPETNKLVTITNGIDLKDYSFLSSEPKISNGYISIVHAGTLNPGYTKYIKALVDFININKEVLLNAKVKFEFCGHASAEMINILRQAPSEIVVNLGILPQKEALRILNRAAAGLIIHKEGYDNIHFITKLYEYMALKKKIIYLSNPNAHPLRNLLSKERIGVTFYPENLNLLLEFIVNIDKSNDLSYANFDISPYEIDNLSKKVESLLKS